MIRFLVGEDYGKYMIKQAFKSKATNPLIEQYLDQARRMFYKYDSDGSGGIDEKELRNMMIDTYQTMGVDFQPTQ